MAIHREIQCCERSKDLYRIQTNERKIYYLDGLRNTDTEIVYRVIVFQFNTFKH